jgi:hypothetical protein
VAPTYLVSDIEKHRLRVFENRVLRRIFQLKRDEVMGGWSKLHNEELHDLYSAMKTSNLSPYFHIAQAIQKFGNLRIQKLKIPTYAKC